MLSGRIPVRWWQNDTLVEAVAEACGEGAFAGQEVVKRLSLVEKSNRNSNLVSCSVSQRQEQIRGGDEGCKFGGGEYRTGGL